MAGESPEIEDAYELTPLQQGMLVDTLREPGVGLYVNQAVEVVEGVDAVALASAWQRVVDRHTILRTSFVWEGLDGPRQRVHREARVDVTSHDWRRLSSREQEDRLRVFLADDRERGFDLARPPLLRLALLHRTDRELCVVITHHHLLLDGWSRPLLLGEVDRCYLAARRGWAVELPPARPFGEFVGWLRARDAGDEAAFWSAYLRGLRAATPLPFDGEAGGGEGGSRFGEWRIQLSAARLRSFARRCRVTVNTLVTAAWALLLSRHGGEREVVLGTLVSGRPPSLAGAESMIGMFMNSVPLRVRVDGRRRLADWLRELLRSEAGRREHEHSALSDVQRWSGLEPGAPLFESMVVDQSVGDDRRGARQLVPSPMRQSLPLVVATDLRANELALTLIYDPRRFEAASIVRLTEQLRTLLESMPHGADRSVDALPMMGAEERRQVTVEWNRTEVRRPRDACLHQLFEAQAARSPDRPAVVFGDRALSYRQLEERANHLAARLRDRGVGPGDPVGVCIERSPPMAIAVLAVLKAGGAVLPLDPGYPPNRLRYMLGDARARVLLIHERLAEGVATEPVDHVVRIDPGGAAERAWAAQPPPCRTHPEELALLLYTSGSTGAPKGVAIPHRVAVNRLYVEHDEFEEREALCAKTSLSFIDSVWELFAAWRHGLCTTLVPERDARDVHRLVDSLASARATRVVLVPSLLRHLLDAGIDLATRLPLLGHWIASGEPLAPDLCRDFAQRLPDAVLTNLYGITEVWDATRCDSRQQQPGATLPIGRPMGNVRAYIVDERLDPAPIGVEGELCIAGEGLARGYWRRPALTAERFVPDPFCERGGGRLYRTGDRGRWRADGNIEYLGRADTQIKLHGHRIEAGEVESALRQHGGVAEAAVVIAGDAQRLTAFVVPRGRRAPRTEELRTLLRRRLPEYMVPSLFFGIDRLPLTPSGKVDRRSLATAGDERPVPLDSQTPSRPPGTPTERTIAAVWTELLGLDGVGAESDFFDLGGDSLLAMRMVSRLRAALRVAVPPSAVFEERTIAALAARIDGPAARPPVERLAAGAPAGVVSVSANRESTAPLAAAQEGLWFLDRLNPGSPSHTIPTSIRFSGPVDHSALREALNEVVRRHETLRTTFAVSDGRPSQLIHAKDAVELPVVELAAAKGDRRAAAKRAAAELARRPWDLEKGPLLRAELLRSSATEHLLAVTMHHIITDGRSMGIFAHELATCYRAFAERRSCPLPELTRQFADFAIWQREWMGGRQCQRQRDYWCGALAGVESLDLPRDRPPPPVSRFRGEQLRVELSGDVTARLRRLAREEGVTTFMVVLAIYQLFLARSCGQDDITVGTPVANRNGPEFERLIGFFVNTLALRTSTAGDPTFRELVRRAARVCLAAYDHADLPFDKVVEALNPERILGRHPVFQAMLVYQGPALGAVELPGVSWRPQAVELETSNFDLLLLANESQANLSLTLKYDADLFDRSTIERMSGELRRLAEAAVAAPGDAVSTLRMLSEHEQHRILQWGCSGRHVATDSVDPPGVHDLFVERARRAPDRTAVRYRDEDISFAELDRRSTLLAHALGSRGVGPEVVVALCFTRSPDAIVAILATLKAGGAFLFCDPTYPAERLEYMIADSGATLVLAERTCAETVSSGPARVIVFDREDGPPSRDPVAARSSEVGPRNLAYLVYTSGSTGRPRGVQVEHRNLANVIRAQIDAFGIGPESRVLQLLSLSFDAAIGEIFRALVAGATLVLADQDSALPGPGLVEALREQRITVAAITPASLALVPSEDGGLPALETLIVGGEPCPIELADRWRTGRRLINGYGPTEATIAATMAVDWPSHTPPPLGRPLPGVTVYVLDQAMQPTPIGAPGELYIGGSGVARGYRDRPDATAERFVPDPFGAGRGGRLYKTGDLARWAPDGNLHFIRRADQQLKIRGHRVEPGEVETALRAHEQVEQCAVDGRSNAGGEQLVAYFTARPGANLSSASPSPGELRSFLRDRLPDYLVPSAVVRVPSIPLNANGKVDRAALPDPTSEDRSDDEPYVAPRTATESALARIWEEVLGIERVGIHSNFFELGGDSLLSIRVVARAVETGRQITAQALFRNQTIAELAEEIGRNDAARLT